MEAFNESRLYITKDGLTLIFNPIIFHMCMLVGADSIAILLEFTG